jgi:hypothetical protein
MLSRLGYVLGSIGKLFAWIFWILTLLYLYVDKTPDVNKHQEYAFAIILFIMGVISYGIGKALRYILAGD